MHLGMVSTAFSLHLSSLLSIALNKISLPFCKRLSYPVPLSFLISMSPS
uniref:Uncharacterized protein n=1 Tax=Populus trichocarpa x Populus deltoides TaxID=3695 RepID=A9PIP8_9ROSI|nr:unknown [Populus trichocarpa x Populus deltoides]